MVTISLNAFQTEINKNRNQLMVRKVGFPPLLVSPAAMTVSFDSSTVIDFREECSRLIIQPQPGMANGQQIT